MFCSWSSCGINQVQGIIDEVHIQQCPVGDAICSELSNVTTIESIQDLDGDGMLDSWELINALDSSNPSDATQDADSDSLTNSNEFAIGTDPQNADTDGDGIDDANEILAGTDPLDSASTPADGDINSDGTVDVVDVLLGYQILIGNRVPTALQLLHADVAPLNAGVPQPDGSFTLGDLVILQRKALGMISF